MQLDKLAIDSVTKMFFSIFTNTGQQKPSGKMIYELCIPQTVIIKKTGINETVYDLDSFIEPRMQLLTDGTLIDFEESEIKEATKIIGNIAQRFSKYKKKGYSNGNYFEAYGNKFFQFIKTTDGWKINSMIWEDDDA